MSVGHQGIAWVEQHSAFNDVNHCRYVDEDFRGINLDTTHSWNVTNTGDRGTNALKNDDPGGVLAMVTGNQIDDLLSIDRNDIRVVDPSLSPVLLVRAKALAVTEMEMRIGLVDVLGTDDCIFEVDVSGDGVNIHAKANAGGVEKEDTDTTINLNTSYHYYGIYIDSAGKPYWSIDGKLKVTGDATDVDPAEFFQPYVEVKTEAAAIKTLEVDVIKGWQLRG